MKGVAMKVGQILSYMDGVLPPETHAALVRLQLGATPVAFEVMARVIEDALGAPVGELFARFDPKPVASASVGQVYRAALGDREVAVKVQYPGIRNTMTSDLLRLRGISRVASLATMVDGPSLVAELAQQMLNECDYLREAQNQTSFRNAFGSDADVRIPAVVTGRTAETVLTSEWCAGIDFQALLERADARRRSHVGQVLVRFAYRSLFELGVLNADPHPGNYLFPEDHTVVFLDFGCVRSFESSFLEPQRELVRVVLDDRRSDFETVLLATGMVPKPRRFDFDLHWQLLCHQFAPYRTAHFSFTSDYLRQGMRFTGPSNPNNRLLAIPPSWIWVQRLIWGLHAVLARLGAEGDFGTALRTALSAGSSLP